jgi:hypothetical protein
MSPAALIGPSRRRLRLGVLWLALAACGTQHGSEPPPDPPDEPGAPHVASVATADGAHEIRQGDSAELIVTGSGLTGATALTVGELAATITSATDTQIHAQIAVPHGFAAQTLALRVTTPAGTAELAAAIATTLYVLQAIGTTINGHSFAGQRITGPAAVRPDYDITASTIQF